MPEKARLLVLKSSKTSLYKRLRNEDGGFAVLLALPILALMCIMGFAIDFSATVGSKSKAQHSLDIAVLAGAKDALKNASLQEVQQVVNDHFERQTGAGKVFKGASCGNISIQPIDNNNGLSASISCEQKLFFMPIFGKERMSFGVSSEVSWELADVEVVFVFDASGSMLSGNRMIALKEAANAAIDIMLPQDAIRSIEHFKIGMVQYNDAIDAGSMFEDLTGITETRNYYGIDRFPPYTGNVSYIEHPYVETWSYCDRFVDGECYLWYGKESNLEPVYETVNPPLLVEYKDFTSTCVFERYGSKRLSRKPVLSSAQSERELNGANAAVYNASSQRLLNEEGFLSAAYVAHYDNPRARETGGGRWLARGGGACNHPSPIGLTQDRTKLANFVQQMKAEGATAGHQGMQWAWYILSPEWHAKIKGDVEPSQYGASNTVKAVIMMTDGDFADGITKFSATQGTSTEQFSRTCEQMKTADEITVYTVAFGLDPQAEQILRQCASGADRAYSANDNNELLAAYEDIAVSLKQIRISS